MSVRAKFQLSSIKSFAWNANSKELIFTPQYDTSIPEDQRFAQATPSGEFRMQVDNPAALEKLELGKFYYFDITEVEEK